MTKCPQTIVFLSLSLTTLANLVKSLKVQKGNANVFVDEGVSVVRCVNHFARHRCSESLGSALGTDFMDHFARLDVGLLFSVTPTSSLFLHCLIEDRIKAA